MVDHTVPPCAPSPWQTPLRFPARCFYDWKKSQWNPPILQGEYIYIYYIYLYIYNIHPILGWWWWALIPDFPSGQWSRLDGPDFFSPQLRWRRAASSQKRQMDWKQELMAARIVSTSVPFTSFYQKKNWGKVYKVWDILVQLSYISYEV